MSPHAINHQHSFEEISITYRMLLGQYCRARKKIESDGARAGWNHLAKPWNWKRSDWSESILPEGHKSGPGGLLDNFGSDIVYFRGIDTLESLKNLDLPTLAVLVEWNRINLVRVDQRFFIRRSVLFLVAALGVLATAYKVDFLQGANAIFLDVLRIFLKSAGIWIFSLVGVVIFFELAVWRPRKSRLEEFRDMLAIAFTYVSKSPESRTEKIKYGGPATRP
jgi:hypothetical protein